jgi:cellulose synthase operon protein C
MTRFIRFHLLLMLALLTSFPALPQTQGGVDILLSKARSLEARGRIDLAADNWHKVLLVNPDQPEALAGLARAAKENGQLDQERSYLDHLRKINPHDPQIAAVEKLHVFTPQERSQLDEAGRLAMQHKPDEAMKIYHQILGDQLPPPGKWAEPFYETEAASTGGRTKAVSQLRQLCAEHPNQEAYRLWLASLLTYDPKTRMEGLTLFESIKDPGVAEQARGPWRQALLWEEQNPEVLAPMEAYLQRYPDPDLQPIVAALHAKQQQNIADAEKASAFKALRNQDVEVADAKFTKVLSQSPNDANAIIGLGYVRLDERRFSEALSLFERARTLAPQRQDARDGYESASFGLAMARGASAQQEGQPAAAVLAYQEALTIRPTDNGAFLGLANALVREHRFADAQTRFQQILNQDPNNADAMAGLGFIRLKQGKFNDATSLLSEAHKLDPARKDVDQGYHNAKFWGIMNQASTALSQHRSKDAVAAYQQALLLNPNDKDALAGLANASERAGDLPTTVKTYSRLAAADPNDESTWLALIHAQLGGNSPQAAISTSQRIPPAVKQQMQIRSDYLSEMALVYYEANQSNEGDHFLRLALETADKSDTVDALSLRLQIAGVFLEQGGSRTGWAIDIYRQATQSHPNNPSGWEGLVGAYIRVGETSQAIAAVRSMPQISYNAALKNTGFLDSVALLYTNRGQCGEAEDFLHVSLAADRSAGRQPSESTQLQLADIWMRERNYGPARDLYGEIIGKDANSAEAWRGYLVTLHQLRADRTLVAEVPQMPYAVRTQLETDPSFLNLEASAYSTAGRNQDALQLLLKARSRYTAEHKVTPVVLEIQTAWTMLAVSADEPGLSDLLESDKKRTDLTSKERAAFEEIYSNWSVRRAEHAFESKPEVAFSILNDAGHEYPGDRNIHAALASLYLRRNDKQGALDTFQSWGMAGAQPGDYRMAAGAALSAHKYQLADQYLKQGLEHFPTDPELMHMTARQDIARGNYEEGERELRAALTAVREEGTSDSEADVMALPNMETNAAPGRLRPVPNGTGGYAGSSQSACKAEPSRGATNEARIRPIALVFFVSPAENSEEQEASGQEAQSQQSPDQSQPQQQEQPSAQQQQEQSQTQQQAQPQTQQQQREQQMEDEVEAVDDRNTPVFTTGGVGTGRVGDAGIDRLIIGDTLLGGAYTASNQMRVGVEAHGVYAYSGTPDGSSNLPFGTLPAGAIFGEQSKIGYSGQAQLSTQNLGLMFGTTPQGFAVHNLTGGVRYRPLNGWFTFESVRDSVKDSLLSYAGSRDPGTGIRWGGIVSNTGTVKFDSAPLVSNVRYKALGEYASASYSFVQGLHVPNNWGLSGNAGVYWQVVQGFTIGVNASAMHYDKDLKYFSFGQGGYFSPQQFYLASIPISWYSRHPRFEYQVKFSGGVQYLHEDATPFYPVLPGVANLIQGTYAPDSSTAPNYDADIRVGYRVAPRVYLGTFATANNSRDYYTQSVGFNVRFMLDPIPTSTDLRVNSIPDWTGRQPFSIH